MNVNFEHVDAGAVDPIIFEKIWGEKPSGGIVPNPSYDLPVGLALGENGSGALAPIKAYRLAKAVAVIDTTIELEKGSGVAVGDFIGHGNVAVECTALNSSSTTKDVVTVTMGIEIAKGTVLFQAKEASVAAVAPVKAGYYDAMQADEGASKVVASAPAAGEVLLATVQASYRGSRIIAANDYVTVVLLPTAEVVGVGATPIYSPIYLTGAKVYAGKGDQLIKLVNSAIVRKETVNASKEVIALFKNIESV